MSSPADIADQFECGDDPWSTGSDGRRLWRAAVVKLSERVGMSWLNSNPLGLAEVPAFGVSRQGTIAAAEVTSEVGERFTLVSMYGLWEKPRVAAPGCTIYADASVHRLISDLSFLVPARHGHKLIAAGDLNVLYGYGENGSDYWAKRYRTIFDRMEAIGVPFVGPHHPNGRQAENWPMELPEDSLNVPTYHSNRNTPATATRQLDFVFASVDLVPRVKVFALNSVSEWGCSDHCRISIEVNKP